MENQMTLQDLQQLTHEQLCDMLTDRRIDWSTWIDAQPETYPGYAGWLRANGLERNDDNARRFADECETKAMEGDKSFFRTPDADVE